MKNGSGNEGYVKGIIYLLIFGLIIAVAVSFAAPFYRYQYLKMQAEGYLEITSKNIQEIEDNIMQTAEELNVPLLRGNLIISDNGQTLALEAHWTEEVDLYGFYQKRFDFFMQLER